ncbi:HK97 gp10 family phage protein [Aneurinibacillus migulanus]|uniref:HK97 gp10 family phage protein n=1 Tax=Aneurinibacillus migulanus TaxID=47500 RepID=UPI0020A06DF4|nr:HK97 gp10 family phage protein [Aneurinibacillus migulanus]MCP1354662.1 HK97 gp10 family phage protein [Aneurinibacillus migulanus]
MAANIELDLSKFIRLLEKTPEAVYRGGKRGLHDAMDDWLAESRDVAPLDKGNLRKQLATEVDPKTLTGEIHGNAVEYSPEYGRFNYGYWLHEDEGQSTKLSTPNTTHKFLDKPAQEHQKDWLRHIESEIEAEAKREGW